MHFPEEFGEKDGTKFVVCEARGLNHYYYGKAGPYERQHHLNEGAKLVMAREPTNEDDANAIKLLHMDGKIPRVVGYVAREIAAILAPIMDAGSAFTAYTLEEICADYSADMMICGEAIPDALDAKSRAKQIASYEAAMASQMASQSDNDSNDDWLTRRRQIVAAIALDLINALPEKKAAPTPKHDADSKNGWAYYGYRVQKDAKPCGTGKGPYGAIFDLYHFKDTVPKRKASPSARANGIAMNYDPRSYVLAKMHKIDPLYHLQAKIWSYAHNVRKDRIERSTHDEWYYTPPPADDVV